MNPVATAILLLISGGLFCWSLARRFLPLLVMQPDIRWDQSVRRFVGMLKYGLGQYRFWHRFERLHGIAHILIFLGALVVSINMIHMVGRGFTPNWHLPGFGHTRLGLAYAFLKDLFTFAVIAGCLLALWNRLLNRPARMIHSLEAYAILLWILGMMVMDLVYESTLFLMEPNHFEQQAAFLGVIGKEFLSGLGLATDVHRISMLHAVGFWGHLALAFSFLNYLPYCKQFHEITSLPGLLMRRLAPKGALVPQNFEDESTLFGVEKIEDFSWKRGLDMYTCAECGRCRANCPAFLTDKPLSPMTLIMVEREHLKKKTPLMWRAALAKLRNGRDAAKQILSRWDGEHLLGEVVSEEAIWSCTTCGHCIANCPLMIEHVNHIIDLRRQLVQVESRFPRELMPFFKGCENMSNPWGLASNTRGDWFSGLDVKTPSENPNFEYLFYVGCAGSFDDRYKNVTIALTKLMLEAGVNFACLGNEEMCCGETARRLGNEYSAQQMISANIRQWKSIGVRKIITACPHCFNTIKNEYPQFGASFEVMHHSGLIRSLIRKGMFAGRGLFSKNGPVVYHDPCYLGRYNGIYGDPREILLSIPGLKLVEADRNKRISFCCGAGGGRMWMEETAGKRINRERCKQLISTGAKTIATACPYCMIMLDDAVKDLGMEEEVTVRDLSAFMIS